MASLSPNELAVVNADRTAKRKSLFVAYLLWFFFGILGFHKAYLEQPGIAWSYILCLCIPVLGWALLALLLFFDIFAIPERIENLDRVIVHDSLRALGKPFVFASVPKPPTNQMHLWSEKLHSRIAEYLESLTPSRKKLLLISAAMIGAAALIALSGVIIAAMNGDRRQQR